MKGTYKNTMMWGGSRHTTALNLTDEQKARVNESLRQYYEQILLHGEPGFKYDTSYMHASTVILHPDDEKPQRDSDGYITIDVKAIK